MTLHIAFATRAELSTCARLIAEALADDAVMRRFVPGEHDRVERLTRFLHAELSMGAAAHGVLDVARTSPHGEIIGVGAWVAPGASTSVLQRLRHLPAMLRVVGPGHWRTTLAAMKDYDAVRPTEPHWYLADLAVSPAARGLGVGSALLDYRLAAVDAAGLPAFLEATTHGSARLYERKGFEHRGEIGSDPASVGYAMYRQPVAR